MRRMRRRRVFPVAAATAVSAGVNSLRSLPRLPAGLAVKPLIQENCGTVFPCPRSPEARALCSR
jgi:hypothetical protein